MSKIAHNNFLYFFCHLSDSIMGYALSARPHTHPLQTQLNWQSMFLCNWVTLSSSSNRELVKLKIGQKTRRTTLKIIIIIIIVMFLFIACSYRKKGGKNLLCNNCDASNNNQCLIQNNAEACYMFKRRHLPLELKSNNTLVFSCVPNAFHKTCAYCILLQ